MQSQNRPTRPIIFAFIAISLLMVLAVHLLSSPQDRQQIQSHDQNDWVQPEALNTRFPNAIEVDPNQFDFASFEPLLWQVRLSDDDVLIVNAELERLLAQMMYRIPPTTSSDEKQRLFFLVAKGFPTEAGERLVRLLEHYIAYHSLLQTTAESEPGALAGNSKHRELQTRFFGTADATALFEQKNRTLDYLHQRKSINLDPSLSDEKKRQQLEALQQEYRSLLETTQGG